MAFKTFNGKKHKGHKVQGDSISVLVSVSVCLCICVSIRIPTFPAVLTSLDDSSLFVLFCFALFGWGGEFYLTLKRDNFSQNSLPISWIILMILTVY